MFCASKMSHDQEKYCSWHLGAPALACICFSTMNFILVKKPIDLVGLSLFYRYYKDNIQNSPLILSLAMKCVGFAVRC